MQIVLQHIATFPLWKCYFTHLTRRQTKIAPRYRIEPLCILRLLSAFHSFLPATKETIYKTHIDPPSSLILSPPLPSYLQLDLSSQYR